MFLRTGKKIKQNPKVFLPSPEPACRPSVFNSPFPPLFWCSFSFKHLHGLGVWLGRGSGGPGVSIASRLGFAAALLPSPPSPPSPPPLPPGFPSCTPKKSLSLSLLCLLLVLFWFWFFLFLFFYNFEVFMFKEKLLYFVNKVWGGETKRPLCLYKETK